MPPGRAGQPRPDPDVGPLKDLAQQLRVDAIRASAAAGAGHPTSAMSAAELMAVLIARHLRVDPAAPHDPARDHLLLEGPRGAAPVRGPPCHRRDRGARAPDVPPAGQPPRGPPRPGHPLRRRGDRAAGSQPGDRIGHGSGHAAPRAAILEDLGRLRGRRACRGRGGSSSSRIIAPRAASGARSPRPWRSVASRWCLPISPFGACRARPRQRSSERLPASMRPRSPPRSGGWPPGRPDLTRRCKPRLQDGATACSAPGPILGCDPPGSPVTGRRTVIGGNSP